MIPFLQISHYLAKWISVVQVAWYVCTVAACIFLVCRLVVRVRLLKRLYVDDLFVIVAALCLIGDLAIQHYMFNLGRWFEY